METLKEIHDELEIILLIFTKLGARIFTEKTLNKKEEEVNSLLDSIEKLKPFDITLGDVDTVADTFNKIANFRKKILKIIKEQKEILKIK